MSNSHGISIRNALISVYRKQGLDGLAPALSRHSVQIFSTGGTYQHLKKLGLDVTSIEKITGAPEMMDGRVKTLHPVVFGGILGRRDSASDLEDMKRHAIPSFDLIVVNFYPFENNLGKSFKEQCSFIDIGGPSMARAAAKNFESVAVLSDPADYEEFLKEMVDGMTHLPLRKRLAQRTFERTSDYDRMIASEWAETSSTFPSSLPLTPTLPLRYGENPHQKAAWIGSASWSCLQGKELSYNNLLDAESATQLVSDFEKPCVAVIKHNTPCGVASGSKDISTLVSSAISADERSAFGGIVAVNRPISKRAAEALNQVFLEVVIAPHFEKDALEILSLKKNLRLIQYPKFESRGFELRKSMGGWLAEEMDLEKETQDWKLVTQANIQGFETDLMFAWLVCKHVRSNAIVIAREEVTLGIGGGQVSRVEAVEMALKKGRSRRFENSVLASDAFFPFRDNIDLLKESGIRAIIQPGGSQKDSEVIAACDELEIAMVFTGKRHFRH